MVKLQTRQEQMNRIRFGTDGWRAIIADGFTVGNVRRVARALSEYLKSIQQTDSGMAISYDTRFMSAQFARHFAEVIASNRIPVYLSSHFTPTPMLSFAVKNRQLAAGVMVTASHNPYFYSGIKFKAAYGGPVMDDVTSRIETFLDRSIPASDSGIINTYIHETDFSNEYRAQITDFIDFDRLKNFKGSLVVDMMHGAASGFMERIFKQANIPFTSIHSQPDPCFGNRLPEPIPKNLEALSETIRKQKADIGLALDGDADRFGVLDENGIFVELHDLMPLLLEYLATRRRLTGKVIRTTSMATTVDKLARELHCEVSEVPVGFKNVTQRMIREDVLIGGEESGGFGYKGHIPERDGILSGLLLLELLADRQATIGELIRELRKKYGPFSYGRIDRYHDLHDLSVRMEILRKNPPGEIGGFRVDRVSTIDGIKFYFDEDTWMLVRVSQTEPLVRIYVAAPESVIVDRILQAGLNLMTGS